MECPVVLEFMVIPRSWFTIFGLLLDIAGFLILAADLWRSFESQLRFQTSLFNYLRLEEKPVRVVGGLAEPFKTVSQRLRHDGLHSILEMRRLKPWLAFAISGIVLGFAFQIVGAWPC